MAVQERKTKIVLDADVIIHFAKAEADAFIAEVRRMSSFPPVVDFDTYVCTKIV